MSLTVPKVHGQLHTLWGQGTSLSFQSTSWESGIADHFSTFRWAEVLSDPLAPPLSSRTCHSSCLSSWQCECLVRSSARKCDLPSRTHMNTLLGNTEGSEPSFYFFEPPPSLTSFPAFVLEGLPVVHMICGSGHWDKHWDGQTRQDPAPPCPVFSHQ